VFVKRVRVQIWRRSSIFDRVPIRFITATHRTEHKLLQPELTARLNLCSQNSLMNN